MSTRRFLDLTVQISIRFERFVTKHGSEHLTIVRVKAETGVVAVAVAVAAAVAVAVAVVDYLNRREYV
tara:strand:+ start:457 stop:660 length:204 start_codon:yes stop_codon:yes gene_type:complete